MENTIGIAGLVTAVIAALSAIIFSYQQVVHNKNSLRPYLDFMTNHSNGLVFVKIKNAGIGPMIIHSMTVTLDGEIKNSVLSSFRGILSRDVMKKYYTLDAGHPGDKKVLSPDMEFPLFYLRLRDDIEIVQDDDFYRTVAIVADTLKRIRVETVYCDIYGKRFPDKRNLNNYFGVRYPEQLPVNQENSFDE